MFSNTPFIRDRIKRLDRAIKRLGGRVLPDPCRSTELPPEGDAVIPAFTTGCGNRTRIALPYDNNGTAGFVTACALDDSMAEWPRIKQELRNDAE
jgi:hypothetical protein